MCRDSPSMSASNVNDARTGWRHETGSSRTVQGTSLVRTTRRSCSGTTPPDCRKDVTLLSQSTITVLLSPLRPRAWFQRAARCSDGLVYVCIHAPAVAQVLLADVTGCEHEDTAAVRDRMYRAASGKQLVVAISPPEEQTQVGTSGGAAADSV